MSQSMLTPSAVSTSAEPERDDSARLPCFATGTPAPGHDQRGGGRDVERARAVAAGAAGVDRARRRGDRDRFRAHDPRRAGDLVDGFAAHPHRQQQPAHLRRGGVARHDDLERGLGLGLAEPRPGGDAGKRRPQICGGGVAHARFIFICCGLAYAGCRFETVILHASLRAKRSNLGEVVLGTRLLRRYAPRNGSLRRERLMALEGGCACGAVRYKLTNAPMIVHACHCRDCQKQTGGAFVINLWIERKFVEASGGRRRLRFACRRAAAASRTTSFAARNAAPRCGASTMLSPGDTLLVRGGTLDDPAVITPGRPHLHPQQGAVARIARGTRGSFRRSTNATRCGRPKAWRAGKMSAPVGDRSVLI